MNNQLRIGDLTTVTDASSTLMKVPFDDSAPTQPTSLRYEKPRSMETMVRGVQFKQLL